jgi:hypothetical protein
MVLATLPRALLKQGLVAEYGEFEQLGSQLF